MNTWLYLVVLTAFQDVVSCTGLFQNCPNNYEDWYPDGDYCYFFPSLGQVHYNEAQNQCLELNSTLISIHSMEQETAIGHKLSLTFEESIWLGISRTDGREWSWMDGSTLDFVNWGTDPELEYDCSYLHRDDKYWHLAKCDSDRKYVLCQEPKSHSSTTSDSITSSTVSSPTTEPDVLSCSLFFRDQCQNDQLDPISYTYESDAMDCQNLCSGVYFDECKSFSFNLNSGLCILKKSTIPAQDQCLNVGGPSFPSIGLCEAKGCQDFYRSDCDAFTQIPIDVIESVENPSYCQMLCQYQFECAQWVHEGQQCRLYANPESCNVLNGPSDFSMGKCI